MRRAGILLHLSSLPSPYGIGTLGQEARDLADFLQAAGQRVWQLLPIGPTGYGDSPYQPRSAFAGNPYLIDLPTLEADGLLSAQEYRDTDWESAPGDICYGALYQKRLPLLDKAARRLLTAPPEDYAAFCAENAFWLPDYARFAVLKDLHGGAPWQSWEEPLRRRDPAAMEAFSARHRDDIARQEAIQYLFFRQYRALKDYVNRRGVSILGDLPIYAAEDSADVWARPQLFQLDPDLRPFAVAGCPPDAFSPDGQLWGNPLFDWGSMAADGFAWWKARLAHHKRLADLLRIDHFRGLSSYFSIPAGAPPREGRWLPGPGMELIRALQAGPGTEGVIAEDLGHLDEAVYALLRESGLPGMKVLQFAFSPWEESSYLPHRYGRGCVVYTGTHDNDTALGWYAAAEEGERAKARAYLGLNEEEGIAWGLMRGAWSSVADLAIVPMQDVLSLGSEARMNTPGTSGGNWRWRLLPGQLTPELARRLHRQMELFGRI